MDFDIVLSDILEEVLQIVKNRLFVTPLFLFAQANSAFLLYISANKFSLLFIELFVVIPSFIS